MDNQWYILATKTELKASGDVFEVKRFDHLVQLQLVPKLSILLDGLSWPHFREQGDSIWICFSHEPVTFMPFWPELSENGKPYKYCELSSLVECPVEPILENFIDCTHTGFVHEGILRGKPTQDVHATVSGTPRGVLISTVGERMASATITRMFNPKHMDVYHTDELILPHTIRVEYRFGKKHVVASSVCAQVDSNITKIYTRVYLKWPLFSSLVLAYLKYSTRIILQQDKVILEDQAKNIKRFGSQFRLRLSADAGALAIRRAWKNFIKSGHVANASDSIQPVTITIKI